MMRILEAIVVSIIAGLIVEFIIYIIKKCLRK